MRPLDGVRVLDLTTGVAGPMTAMELADFGADVVKVEPPPGDPARTDPGFAFFNRGKRSRVVDTGTGEGRVLLEHLLAAADVVVLGEDEGGLAARGLSPAAVADRHPHLVVVHTPPFDGDTTPWAGGAESAELLAAVTGIGWSQASWEDVPVDIVSPHVLYGQAIWAAAATVAALHERRRSSFGQVVTVGGLHGMLVTTTASLVHPPGTPRLHFAGGPGGQVPFYRTYRCADGEWLFLACLTPAFMFAAFQTLGVLDIFADPRLDGDPTNMLLPENGMWVIERVASVFGTRPRTEWIDVLSAAGCPVGPLAARDEWIDHPQLAAIGMRVEIADPERGPVVQPGISLNLTGSPGEITGPAPLLGEHQDAGDEWDRRPAPVGPAPSGAGPLAGTRVLDLGSIIAGTYGASLLAELGADVVKVEPLSGDGMRGLMVGFAGFHKGKRGLVLDLSTPEGHAAFLRLVADADVVVDNYRPGVLARLGIDYHSLVATNPAIITVSVTGFGEGGPLGAEPGFDPLLQALSGMMTAQGGDADPVFLTLPVNDVGSAATAALGTCLALVHRDRTGRGQRVWTSLAGQAAVMQAGEIIRFPGRPPARTGSADHPGPSPLDRYHRTADGWVRLQAPDSAGLVAAGLLDSPDGDVGAAFGERSSGEVLAVLTAAGVPAVPALATVDLPGHPLFTGREALHEIPVEGGKVWTAGRFARFSRTERTDHTTVPGLGEHGRDVLAAAGFVPADIEALVASEVTVIGPPFRI